MKKSILFITALILVFTGNLDSKEVAANTNTENTSIHILSTPDLYKIVNQWSSEYTKLNPGINIEIDRVTETEITEIFQERKNIGFVSSPYFRTINAKSNWQILIGRDVIVPIFNLKNPFLNQINEKGLSAETITELINNPNKMDWGTLFNDELDVPIHYYMSTDESIKSGLVNFLKIDQNAIHRNAMESPQEMISSIQNDPYAMGFCKLVDIIDLADYNILKNIQILPLDKNNNGKIDYYENIYKDLQTFLRGVWIGKYPKTLSNNIYSISPNKPVNETEVAFLKWVLTDGQQFLMQNGYSDLAFGERQMKLDKLRNDEIFVENSNDRYATQKIILFIIIGIALFGLIISRVIRYERKKKEAILDIKAASSSIFNENSLQIPNGLYFDKSHTWAFMDKDGIVKVGIDDFMQHVTGSLTRTILKNPGEKVKKGEQIMTLVQDGKHLNIYAPISGTIEEFNEMLVTDSSVINSSPYDQGWVYMIEPSNWLREVDFLKMAESYKQWLINEFTRLKDFISVSAKSNSPAHAHVVFQEGGELQDNILQDFGPEVWEDFQKHFIDTSQLR